MNNQQTAAKFDHEKLEVYQLELRFIEWVTPLLEEVSNSGKNRTREVCDQLDRASLSTLLNTAEGNGKRQRPGRAKFFDDARGSATECAACLDALIANKAATQERVEEGKALLVRIVSILCRLVERFSSAEGFLREDPTEYRVAETQDGRGAELETRNARTRTRTRRRTRTT